MSDGQQFMLLPACILTLGGGLLTGGLLGAGVAALGWAALFGWLAFKK